MGSPLTPLPGTKVFAERHGLKLVGDARDIMVPNKYQSEVLRWCAENGIVVEVYARDASDAMAQRLFNVNLWRVKDEAHRTLFILRWT